MLKLRMVAGSCAAVVLALTAGTSYAQNTSAYPDKPIRLVTQPPGGGVDYGARLIAGALSSGIGQQVIVENRAALSARETVARAPADGYTLLFDSSGVWVEPFLHNVSWDPVKDFAPITSAVGSPNILVVHPALPVKSVKDLIALAKAKPGALNYGSSGNGATNHLAAALFKSMAGINIVHIPYKGVGPGITDLISGQVQIMFGTAGSVGPHMKSGRLVGLAVTTAQKSALYPNLPTMGEFLPGYESPIILGLFAPAKTPDAIIKRLNQEVVRVLNRADIKEKFFNTGSEIVGSSPEEFGAEVKADMVRWGKVIKDAGIRAD